MHNHLSLRHTRNTTTKGVLFDGQKRRPNKPGLKKHPNVSGAHLRLARRGPRCTARRATPFKFKNVVAARFSSATRTSRVATPPFPSRARARQFREKRRKKETLWHHPISRYRSTRLRDDDTTNDVSKIKSYLDVVERPFTEEFHFLRGEFSHDVRALCVARCSFSRFSQLYKHKSSCSRVW